MKKALFELLKSTVFVAYYYVGDIIFRYITGRNEFPKYYWVLIGLWFIHQIMRDINEIKNKVNKIEENN